MLEIPQISVLIPLYRGCETIRGCIESLLAQTGVSLEILMLDNGCPDDTGEWAGYYLSEKKTKIKWNLLEEPKNIGFAAGMNVLYKEASAKLVCFLNQDVELEPDHLSVLYASLDRHPDWAGVCGTLFQPCDRPGRGKIDTTGHVIYRDRIVRNRGYGLTIQAGEDPPWPEGEVFGISAACALYRRDSLESAREIEGPFDPDFFSYFEDIDLDYRLHRAGWKLGYIPAAIGTHSLGGSGGRYEPGIRIRAYGNRRRIMWKHESLSSLLPDIVPIIIQDLYGSVRALFTDPLAWLIGPWHLIASFVRILNRRKRMDKMWGTDRNWIREWLRSEVERVTDRGKYR